ncbi:MAG: hypothetical protein DSY83_05000 [Flavobacteriia bacterium]|nr:MAG: hypothetical protein DSY83_05000 [Flavobacteriia bacterium]
MGRIRGATENGKMNHPVFRCSILNFSTLLVILLCSFFSGEDGMPCPFFAGVQRKGVSGRILVGICGIGSINYKGGLLLVAVHVGFGDARL